MKTTFFVSLSDILLFVALALLVDHSILRVQLEYRMCSGDVAFEFGHYKIIFSCLDPTYRTVQYMLTLALSGIHREKERVYFW
jgi:hypothetical protein